MTGLWCEEFQKVGRPHVHLYLGLPEAVSGSDYEGLRQRTVLGKELGSSLGKYHGARATLPAIGGKVRGASSATGAAPAMDRDSDRRERTAATLFGVWTRVVFFFSDKDTEAEADRLRRPSTWPREVGEAAYQKPPQRLRRRRAVLGHPGR